MRAEISCHFEGSLQGHSACEEGSSEEEGVEEDMLFICKPNLILFDTQEYRDAQKKKKAEESRSSEAMSSLDTSKFTTLFEWLDSATSEAVVGLEQVECSLSFPPFQLVKV